MWEIREPTRGIPGFSDRWRDNWRTAGELAMVLAAIDGRESIAEELDEKPETTKSAGLVVYFNFCQRGEK